MNGSSSSSSSSYGNAYNYPPPPPLPPSGDLFEPEETMGVFDFLNQFGGGLDETYDYSVHPNDFWDFQPPQSAASTTSNGSSYEHYMSMPPTPHHVVPPPPSQQRQQLQLSTPPLPPTPKSAPPNMISYPPPTLMLPRHHPQGISSSHSLHQQHPRHQQQLPVHQLQSHHHQSQSQSHHSPDSQTPSPARAKPLLSTPQKRLNHIMSEQKRRNAIRDGYAQLIALLGDPEGAMPTRGRPKGRGRNGPAGGKDGGSGKSGVLFRAVEYIKWLEEGKEALKKEVDRWEAENSRNGNGRSTHAR